MKKLVQPPACDELVGVFGALQEGEFVQHRSHSHLMKKSKFYHLSCSLQGQYYLKCFTRIFHF
jgi:hypothetical protein